MGGQTEKVKVGFPASDTEHKRPRRAPSKETRWTCRMHQWLVQEAVVAVAVAAAVVVAAVVVGCR